MEITDNIVSIRVIDFIFQLINLTVIGFGIILRYGGIENCDSVKIFYSKFRRKFS